METDEFVAHAPLDAEVLEAWIEAGWLLPRQDGAKRNFFDVDLARAHLRKHGELPRALIVACDPCGRPLQRLRKFTFVHTRAGSIPLTLDDG